MCSNDKKALVTILVPCYREEKTLPVLYEALFGERTGIMRTCDCDCELLLINDGSPDSTQDVIEELANRDRRVRYISLSRNFGKESAMLAGFDYAQGDCVIVMDADMQDPPNLIPQMIDEWKIGFQDVYAKRRNRGKESWLRKRLSLAFYSLLQRTSRFDVLENVGDYRLLDKKCVEVLKQMREVDRYTKGMFAWIGFKKKEILFDRGNREAGESAWSLFSLFHLAVDGITSFTTAPLRISTIVGFVVSMMAFVYMCIVFVKALIWGDPVAGYPSLMMVILFLGGVQLLSLGIIGEYLARIFNQSKNRPVYVVEKSNIEK